MTDKNLNDSESSNIDKKQTAAHTVLGFFNTGYDARVAIGELKSRGFKREMIHLSEGITQDTTQKVDDADLTSLFSNLIGADARSLHYAEIAKKSTVVTVYANSDQEAQEASEILDKNGAVDVDELEQPDANEGSQDSDENMSNSQK